MNKIKIILVDDHHIVRDGIKSLLQNEQDISVIAEASDFIELNDYLSIRIPDIILLDISLPNISGIEITKILKEKYPEIRVVILSMHINEEFIINAFQSGACGYLAKNTTKKELLEAIRFVYDKGEYYSPMISKILAKSFVKIVKNENKEQINENLLSRREIEILKLFADGYSNGEIADKLFISTRTVESHKNHIMQKLGLKSSVDMVKFAIKNGIVDI